MTDGNEAIPTGETRRSSSWAALLHASVLCFVFALAWGAAHVLSPVILDRGESSPPPPSASDARLVEVSPTRDQQLEALGVDPSDTAEDSRPATASNDRETLRPLVGSPHPSSHELLLLTCEARQFRSVHAVATGPTTLLAPLPSATVAVAVRDADGTWWRATVEGRDENGLFVLRTDPGAGLVAARFSDALPGPGDVVALRAPRGRGDLAITVASSAQRGVFVVPESRQDEGFVVTDGTGRDVGILRASDGRFEVVPVVAASVVMPADPETCEGRRTYGPQAGVSIQQVDGPADPVILDLLLRALTTSNQRGDTLRSMVGDDASRDVIALLAERSIWDVRLAILDPDGSRRSQPGRILRAVKLQAVEVDGSGCWIAEHRLVVSLPMFASGSPAVVIEWSADTQDRRPCPAQD